MFHTLLLATSLLFASHASGDTKTVDRGELLPRFEVKEVQNLVYHPLADGEDATKNKNKLDVDLPQGVRNFPVIFFIHGGAWVFGDKNEFGLYHNLANYWARRGIGVVVANYRLSPGVKHPAHIQDVAKAFAWTKTHIAEYGGDVRQLFVSGQSAGGHLVSLLATDDSYLNAEGLKAADIHGVLTLSGVYGLPARFAAPGLSGAGGAGGKPGRVPFASVFGSDPKMLRDAAPVNHIHAGLPPFLVLYAQNDPKILRDMAAEFDAVLKRRGKVSSLWRRLTEIMSQNWCFSGRKPTPLRWQ